MKINGYCIELGEICSVLLEYLVVGEVVVFIDEVDVVELGVDCWIVVFVIVVEEIVDEFWLEVDLFSGYWVVGLNFNEIEYVY